MSKTKKTAARAANLKARFARIKAGIQVIDQLSDAYFERRADEIEAFGEELQELTTEAEAAAVN